MRKIIFGVVIIIFIVVLGYLSMHLYNDFFDFLKDLKGDTNGDSKYGLNVSDWVGIFALLVSAGGLIVSIISVLITAILSYLVYDFTVRSARRDETKAFIDEYLNLTSIYKDILHNINYSLSSQIIDAPPSINWPRLEETEDRISKVLELLNSDSLGKIRGSLTKEIDRLENINDKFKNVNKRLEEEPVEQREAFLRGQLSIYLGPLKKILDSVIKEEEELNVQYTKVAKNGRTSAF